MQDINAYIDKFGNSVVKWNGERNKFRDIVLKEKNIRFINCLKIFVTRLNQIDFSPLDNVRKAEPIYDDYCNFIEQFITIQVEWFSRLQI